MISSYSLDQIDLRLLHILDGKMSSALEEQGFNIRSSPGRSSAANLTNPDLVVKIHLSFIESGADIIHANTYQANITRLTKQVGEEEALKHLTKGVELANKAVKLSDKLVYVVGSIGPFSTSLVEGSNCSDPSVEEIKQNFETQVKALYNCGVRAFAFETIPSLKEAICAKEVLEDLKCDGWISVVCKDDQHLQNGDNFVDVVEELGKDKHVKAIGINCTRTKYITNLMKLGAPLLNYKGFVIYPNCSQTYDDEEAKVYGNVRVAKVMEDLEDWIKMGALIIGGCCGVKPEDIKEIAEEITKMT